MLQSKLFYKTIKGQVKGAEGVSHKYLLRGGFIEQVTAGIYNFLPLGFRVLTKIEKIIREEMNRIGGQEVFLATLQPKELWQRSGRWDNMEPPLFKLRDRHKKELALGPTHEEVITEMVRSRVHSYKDLPFSLYQIQNKFRNELRASGGLLRVREFLMKDLYSFHSSQEDLDQYYLRVAKAYHEVFNRCGLEAIIMSEAGSGSIGGSECHEFQLLNKRGEDKILWCRKCNYAVNQGSADQSQICPQCQSKLVPNSSIELGHIFKLDTLYSEKMEAYFRDKEAKKKPIVMGCYGIGVGRLMAAIVEDKKQHDKQGIIWPSEVSPFDLHLIALEGCDTKVKESASDVYKSLTYEGFDVLYDDREEIQAGEKFVESDLIGIPVRLVVSQKTGNKVEYKKRSSDKVELLELGELIEKLKEDFNLVQSERLKV